tara:strand:- start:43 stop:4929 length:4887 start_codon:yes stop_codon:yes gene_type:complete
MTNSVFFPSHISEFAPPSIEGTVIRESQLQTIQFYLKSCKAVVVSGAKNLGKTILLSQYVERFCKDALTIFVSDKKSELVTDKEVLRDLYLQALVLLEKDSQLEDIIDKKVTLSELREIFKQLSYRLKLKQQKAVFVLDGLFDANFTESFVADLFFAIPTSQSIKLIVSTSSQEQIKYIQGKQSTLSVPVFDIDQICELVPNCSAEDAKHLLTMFNGVPDRIATVARLVTEGASIADILSNESDSAKELYEQEYNLCTSGSNLVDDILGLITFSESELTSLEVSRLLSVELGDVEKAVEEISFINNNKNKLMFTSPGYINFLNDKYKETKIKYIDILIAGYDENDTKNKREIIKYLNAKGDSRAVIGHLNGENICSIYENTSSLSEVHRVTQIGLKASLEIDDVTAYNSFNHLKCALSNVDKSVFIVNELECYLTEGDHSKALELIESATSYEERLQLYCIYAIYQKNNQTELTNEVEQKILFLYEKVTSAKLGVERATNIAADLLPVFPEKALELINSLDELESAGQNKSDAAFYRMSLLTLSRYGDRLGDDLSGMSTKEDKRTEMFNSVEIFSPDSTPERIIEHIDGHKQVGDKIFLLRAWLIKNYKRRAATDILLKIIEISTSTTEFSIDASFFADISKVITVSTGEKVAEGYEKLVSHAETIKEKGPTIEFTKFSLNLAIYENAAELQTSRVDDLFQYLSLLADQSIALSCLSIMSLNLEKVGRKDLLDAVQVQKEYLFNEQVKIGAYHLDIFREAIKNEAAFNLTNAIKWSRSLNTSERRSKAVAIALATYFKKGIHDEEHSFNDLISIVKSIGNESFREDIYILLVRYFFDHYYSNKNKTKLKRLIFKIKSNYVKANCLIELIIGLYNKNSNPEIIDSLKDSLKLTISKVDGFKNKTELYFKAHKELYSLDRELAVELKNEALDLKEKSLLRISDLDIFNKMSIDLSIRCIYELERLNLNNKTDIEFITSKAMSLGSDIDKCYYISRLISCFQKNNNTVQANLLIENSLIPILDNLKEDSEKEFVMCAYHSLPVIFRYQYDNFFYYFQSIDDLYADFKENILMRIVDYTLNDCLLYDPYNGIKNKTAPSLNYIDLRDSLRVLNISSSDNTVIFASKKLLSALQGLKRKDKVTKVQVEEAIQVIKATYTKFPFAEGIQHGGYLLFLKALIKNFDERYEEQSWEDILQEARNIANLSDRAFVLIEIASLLPSKSSNQKKSIFIEAEAVIKQLSSELEKLNRYSVLCENAMEVDKKTSQKYFKAALALCAKGEDANSKEAKLRFIDMVSRFDETFSSSLVTMNDDDPARVQSIKDSIRKKKAEQELEEKFKKNTSESAEVFAKRTERVARIAWSSLGDLNARNQHFNNKFVFDNVITPECEYPFDYYYKVLSFYIHYLAAVHQGQSNYREKIRPIFDSIKTNIVTINSLFALANEPQNDSEAKSHGGDTTFSDGNNELSRATDFFKDWFIKTSSDELTVIDPYIDFQSLRIIGEMINKDPDVDVFIYTSVESNRKLKSEGCDDIAEGIERFWNDNIAKGSLPSITITFIKYGSDKGFPIHDRYIYTDSSMICPGSSLSGIGKRITTVSKQTDSQMQEALAKFLPIIEGKQRKFRDQKISSNSIMF